MKDITKQLKSFALVGSDNPIIWTYRGEEVIREYPYKQLIHVGYCWKGSRVFKLSKKETEEQKEKLKLSNQKRIKKGLSYRIHHLIHGDDCDFKEQKIMNLENKVEKAEWIE